jgi:hypothetical protein
VTPARGLALTVLLFLGLWLVLTLAMGCAVSHTRRLEVEAGAPRVPAVCDDGAAPRLLTDPACAAAGCGWSCLPGRWTAPGGAIGLTDRGWPW